MNKEGLILKGIERHFTGKEVLFKVESLHKHFDGLLIHETDVIQITEEVKTSEDADEGTEKEFTQVDYVKVSDINFDNAVSKEVVIEEVLEETPEPTGMSYAEAEALVKKGKLISGPDWTGLLFANIHTGEVLVLNSKGEVVENPLIEDRNDFFEVKATPEQEEFLVKYFQSLKESKSIEDNKVVDPKTIEVPADSVKEVKKETTSAPATKNEKSTNKK